MEGDWKLIHHQTVPANSELYNLASDPRELENVHSDSPQVVARLLAHLQESGAMTVRPPEDDEPLSEEALEKLRSLGYIGN